MYSATFDFSSLPVVDSLTQDNTTEIYVRLGNETFKEPTNGALALPATESMSELKVVCVELFELR